MTTDDDAEPSKSETTVCKKAGNVAVMEGDDGPPVIAHS